MNRQERAQGFVREIWNWYEQHKRNLPWRDLQIENDAQRAYLVLVSEVMLQQTQVSRVEVIFKRFLEEFPTLQILAKASNRAVILAWRGLGYNSRALRLRDAANGIREMGLGNGDAEKFFPREMEELMKISGVGHYTAAAIRNFAFNIPTPCLDTNIRRILHRTFVGPEHADGTWKKDDRFLLTIAQDVLSVALDGTDGHDAANWHAALMDFGSLVCTKTHPKWEVCPLTKAGLMKMKARHAAILRRACLSADRLRMPAKAKRKEPGRFVGSRYVPNRIFRGRIIEELRDEPRGLRLDQIGSRVCIDWKATEHRSWLTKLIERLITDRLVSSERHGFVLAE